MRFHKFNTPLPPEIIMGCQSHGPVAVYEAFVRFFNNEAPDDTALPSLGLTNPPAEARFSEDARMFLNGIRAMLPEEYLARELIVYYKNDMTKQSRHSLLPLEHGTTNFHQGFTREDCDQGWAVVFGMRTVLLTEADIAAEHERIRASFR